MEKGHTRNIKLTMEYDGSRYAGWQKQAGGNRAFKIPTVTFWLWYTAGQVKGVS